MTPSSRQAVVPRPAATLVVVRDGHRGPEVLLVERGGRGFFGGLWVFPGGAVESEDCSLRAVELTAAPPDADDVALRVTAMRETAEEAGLLLTVPATDEPVVVAEGGFFDLLEREGKRLDGEALRLLSRWVTPEYAPVRFDTWFYLTVVTTRQAPIPRPGEIMDARWARPSDALAKVEEGEWSMVTPTMHHLRWLASFPDSAAIWRSARRGSRHPVEPVIEEDGSEVRIRLPDTARLP